MCDAAPDRNSCVKNEKKQKQSPPPPPPQTTISDMLKCEGNVWSMLLPLFGSTKERVYLKAI